ncbi:hypothetical protein HNY73_002732 [Argiope bruennichi]|uniref:Uncharacterized protein n=1 Tax=Argiope bruennichi TaxID=94029 RepID=A0A8T0FVS4_ARGBR|nr:hypothetical protein HNY73_002732 [Argiope bruennichi]
MKEKWSSFTLTGAVREKSPTETDEEELLWNLALSILWLQCMAVALVLELSYKEKEVKKVLVVLLSMAVFLMDD